MRTIACSAFFAAGFLLALSAPALAQLVVFPADNNGQITFVMPSHSVECTYTPAGVTRVYKTMDGGPELSCDRREPRYVQSQRLRIPLRHPVFRYLEPPSFVHLSPRLHCAALA